PADRRDPGRAGPAQRLAVRRRVQPHGRRAHAHLGRLGRGELRQRRHDGVGDVPAWLMATRGGVDPYAGFVVCAAALFLLGFVVQRVLVQRIVDAPHEMQILLMLGVALVLENAALLAFGPEPQRVRSALAQSTLWLGPVFVDVARLIAFGVAVVLTLLLSLFLFRTDLGRSIRAAADNTYGALVIGTDVRRVYAVAFGVGAACVGAAGALVAPLLPFQPPTGLQLSVAAF